MAYTFTVNQNPATGAETIFILKARLKAAGWTVPSSSDGTTYNGSGDQISSAGTGAGGMANSHAWFVIRDPAGVREFCFQKSNANNQAWRIKYSALAKFSGGSPAALVTPTATDQQVLTGGGTDASPTYTALWGTDNTYRLHAMADNAAPYGWYCVAYNIGGWSGSTGLPCLMFDPVLSADSLDTDQAVVYLGTASDTGPFGTAHLGGSTSGPKGYLKKGMVGEGFVTVAAATYTVSATAIPHGLPSNPHSGKDDAFPILYVRPASLSAPQGYKGVSSLARWRGLSRTTGSTLTVNTSKDRIVINQVELPWDGTTDPLI